MGYFWRWCFCNGSDFKVPEGHHPRGTTLREALRGNLPLRGLCGGLWEGSAGSLRGFCGVSAGFCGVSRDFPRVFGGSDLCLWPSGTVGSEPSFGGSQKGGFQKGGFGGCSPGTKTGTRVRSPKPPFWKPPFYLPMTLFGVDKRVVSKRVVSADVPPEWKPERGYVRQNHPFTKPPLYLPVTLSWSAFCGIAFRPRLVLQAIVVGVRREFPAIAKGSPTLAKELFGFLTYCAIPRGRTTPIRGFPIDVQGKWWRCKNRRFSAKIWGYIYIHVYIYICWL